MNIADDRPPWQGKTGRHGGCVQVRDLTPLQGMPLTSLDLRNCPADPGPVRPIKTLKTISHKPAAQFWQEYDAKQKGKP